MTNANAILQQQYLDQDFRGWVAANGYTLINADNVCYYRMMFESIRACGLRNCSTCTGSFLMCETEAEMAAGNFQHRRCDIKSQAANSVSAEALKYSFKIPKTYADVSWDGLTEVPEPSKTSIRKYIRDFPDTTYKGLYLFSRKNSTGKTSMLWLIIKELVHAKKIFKGFILKSMPEFLMEMRIDEQTTDHSLYFKAMTCDLLMLDDLGKEKTTSWVSDRMFSIIDHRHNEGLPIIVASNVPLDEGVWVTDFERAFFARLTKMTTIIKFES